MESVVLVIHLILAVAIIGLVLLQRSEGGGLGIGGGGVGGLMSAQGTANALTRATAIAAGLFFTTSLILGILAGGHHRSASLLDTLDENVPAVVETIAEDVEEKSESVKMPPKVPVSE